MGAELVQQANAPLGVPKGHELLARELHAHWRAIRLRQFLGQQRWNPVAAHCLSHGGARARSGDQFILFMDQHAASSSPALPCQNSDDEATTASVSPLQLHEGACMTAG